MVTAMTIMLNVDEVSDKRRYNLRHESADAVYICSLPVIKKS